MGFMGFMGFMGEMGLMGALPQSSGLPNPAHPATHSAPVSSVTLSENLFPLSFCSICMETKKAAASRLLPILYRIEKLKFYFMKLD